MNRILLPLAVLIFASTSLTACAPEEAAVCEHLVEVMKDNADRESWLDTQDQCVKRMQDVKKRWGVNSYRREVDCFLSVDTSFKVKTCIQTEARRR